MKKIINSNLRGFFKDNIILILLLITVIIRIFVWELERITHKDFVTEPFTKPNNLIFYFTTLLLIVLIIALIFQTIKQEKLINFERFNAQNSKDELLSLASHQLRTPATAVKQYLGMILEGYAGDITPEQFDLIKRAYGSNERQLETINQILYVTKADAGRLQLQKSYFNLNQLVDEVITELKQRFKEKNQKLEFLPKYVNMTIYADKHSIRMIIENLLTNASKYTHKGGKITVKTDKKSNIAIFTVEDNGVGISFEDRSKLFRKFSRIDNELSIEAGGSGIGLYLDKLLVEMHGGHIRVISQPQKGTLFSIHLPLLPGRAKLGVMR